MKRFKSRKRHQRRPRKGASRRVKNQYVNLSRGGIRL